MAEEKKSGVLVPYMYIVTMGLMGFASFFSLWVGSIWLDATLFDHIILSGAFVGLGSFGIILGLPVMNIWKERHAVKVTQQKLINDMAEQNIKGRPTSNEMMNHGGYEDEPLTVGVVRNER